MEFLYYIFISATELKKILIQSFICLFDLFMELSLESLPQSPIRLDETTTNKMSISMAVLGHSKHLVKVG